MQSSIATITFFNYRKASSRWWAFKQMGLAHEFLSSVPGVSFYKMLGSGGARGFSIWPNFGAYGLLMIWHNESAAEKFFAENEYYAEMVQKSSEQWTIYMRSFQSHGYWEGQQPFEETIDFKPDQPVCVITRATIYTKYLWRFWRFVPPVSRSVHDKDGKIFTIGIGELPIVQQATFSVWRNAESMKAYAYKSEYHKKVVQKTRELGWYKEELFARFHPYRSKGSWNGKNPLAESPLIEQA